ncbi:uncharacterized protein LOC114842062 isoform X2 [Betta splendens]|uniref:Uncharacterized protein LOC114842062 isoform X2 n=1 Tax=Betta splendens TaxID=158456 RepID=A0A6P7KLC9_BETSP|nr:uncharacterized protein LOC114842062 isoform X2 [Betta splendens]
MGLRVRAKACWLGALLAAVTAQAAATVYKKLGDEVVLTPDSVSDVIESIQWKEGSDIAMAWDLGDPNISSYRQFRARGSLNTATGQMTITGLTLDDSNKYTPEINSKTLASIDLRVISAVAVPSVTFSCNDGKTSCLLTCDGSSAEAEPVTYTWWTDSGIMNSTTRQLQITKDNSSLKEFSCELQNPVSLERSAAIHSPLPNAAPPEEGSQMKVIKGVIVFLCLLVPLLLLITIHRFKTGVCFYEKESLPWSQDFWTKENTSEDRADRSRCEMEEQRLTKNGGSGSVEAAGGSEP